ncbi:MAG: hypothetical protein JST38_14050 [Bacteroidetes bacterium]|nr:hypothetical protein [Bacteroidota bacterium]MBS1941991.1 hypothetical protein [Bacteroidota bacterium]
MVQAACGLHHASAQQGLNNLWTGGYTYAGIDTALGGINIDYMNGSQVITTVDRDMNYFRTVANITDSLGNLLFSTNGVRIADATGNTMQNGDSLNPSWYTADLSAPPDGLLIPQACLILPKPDAPGIFYLFHSTLDDIPYAAAHHLYLTTIDMSLNGGLGGVVSKNQVLFDDTLNEGRITAVRHANGRDWWLFCHKDFTNVYHRLLVTPAGVEVNGTQSIGIVRGWDIGSVCFSPDGSRFAYIANSGGLCRIDLFDFDRCTGLFSNPVLVETPDTNFAMGVSFSPNSRYLYATATTNVYQFDTEAADIAASQVHIAHWDSTYSPFPPFATMFDMAQLAPDGKIYIGTGNSTLRLHVINNPDEPGLACNMEQHGVVLPRYFVNSLPNHPNYHLGPVDGSVCDSLGLGAGINAALSGAEGRLLAVPNPSLGQFMLHYPAHAGVGWLEVRNLAGQVVLRERIPQWSTVHEVVLEGEAAGMYQCSLRWGLEIMTTRIVIAEP